MLLGRLRIRARLAVLVNIPMVAMIVLTIAATVSLSADASRANDTANTVREARTVSTLVRALQEERLLAVGLLVGLTERGDLLPAQAATDEAAAAVTRLGLPDVNSVVANLSLSGLRNGLAVGGITPAQIIAYYGGLALAMIDSVHLLDAVDADTPQGRQVLTLDAVLRANEGFASILAAMAASTSPNILPAYIGGLATLQPAGLRLIQTLSPEQLVLYQAVIKTFDGPLGPDFATKTIQAPGSALANLQAPPPFPALVTLTGSARLVESKIITDALAAAESSARSNTLQAAGFLAFALLFMVLAAVLGNVIGFSVVTPLLRLTRSANRVATLAESELVRVSDDDSLEGPPPRLQPIEVAGRDELADFARAFGRVQETAARLVERQVASRRNVALMFRHVGRRTQNLVGRQISLIDKLESQETEPDRLQELYRLDHISSRLRRSANSLVVLSGASGVEEHIAPIAIDDVIRLALGEIEDYTRVDIAADVPDRVVPALITDLVLLLAELMENATGFSPPGTRVVVAATSTGDGLRVDVIDNGLGLSPDQIAHENARFTRRERLDLAPTEVLGLFVVGRLARRHGLTVSLAATPGGGVTATLLVPPHLLAARAIPAPVPMQPRTALSSVGPGPGLGGPGPARSGPSRSPSGPSVPPGAWPGITGPHELAVDPEALDRAARTIQELRPWNAFDTATRPGSGPDHRIPHQRSFSTTPPPPAGSSTLHRRTPGATLESLPGMSTSVRPAQLRASSAEDARDSLAQFESGVARAMSDIDRDEGRA